MGNDIDKMTRKSQEAMQAAAGLAESKQNPTVEPEHLLFELVKQSEGVVPRLIDKAGGSTKLLSDELMGKLAKLPTVSGTGTRPAGSQRIQKVFHGAEKQAQLMGDSFISTEHFFLSMMLGD